MIYRYSVINYIATTIIYLALRKHQLTMWPIGAITTFLKLKISILLEKYPQVLVFRYFYYPIRQITQCRMVRM
ncbi:hypothetical protein CDL31_24230 [Enterobacter kobei]|nr:hypothetical protein CDL31_24230 [Enterobacter kobei]